MIPKVIPALLIATLVLFFAASPSFAQSTLTLTVTTDKHAYGLSDPVYVGGSLYYYLSSLYVSDAVVGVEVRNPSGSPFILRALPTDSSASQNWLVNFTEFYPCDSNGVPKYSFQAGESVYLHAEWTNFDDALAHPVQYGVTIYDANSVSLGFQSPLYYVLPPNSTQSLTFQVTMIPTSTRGNITLYASLFSDFPRNGGYPYCPELNATVTIGTATSNIPFELSSGGTYNFSFKLPSSGVPYGNYIVYASTYYNIYHNIYYPSTLVTSNATFHRITVGDINGDGVVNILDAILLANAFLATPSSSNWNPKADLNGDGAVNILDAIILANNFGLGS
ncbi:MAG: dockerin type I domain-containing protein [Candidatus Bathyarchaeia archaeon]|jgi:hypothetical protein